MQGADLQHQPERWHVLTGAERYERLQAECRAGIENNRTRRTAALEFASVVEGVRLSSFARRGYQWGNYKVFHELEIPIVRNTCRAIVRTALSKIAALDNPLPQFMTTGGDWAQRIKNIKLDHMVESELDQPQGIFDSTHEAHRHGVNLAISCTGSYLIFVLAPPNASGPRVELDDTLSVQFEISGRFGKPISMVRTCYYAASELCEWFPDHKDAIYANEQTEDDEEREMAAMQDGRELIPGRCVAVRQGWRVGAKDLPGSVCWVLDDGTCLWDAEYTPKELPCGNGWHFERALFSEWGTPLTHTIYHQCIRINEIIQDVDKAERNSPQGWVFHTAEHNKDGAMSQARGWNRVEVDSLAQLPTVVPSPKWAPQSVELLNYHEQGAYTASGVSEANVAAKKSVGTTSGKHEHLVAAVFTERFAEQERSLTRYRAVTTGRLFVYALKELAARDKDYRRVWNSKGAEDPEEISAADLDLDAEKYVTTIAAVSEDKDSPKDRAEKAYEQLQMGEIDSKDYTALLMHFDSMALDEGVLAQSDWIDQQIGRWLHASEEQIVKRDFYQSPSKWMDLTSALSQVSTQWLVARGKGAPRNRLAFFERFMSECQVYLDRQAAMQPPQAPAMPPMGGMPV